MTTESFPAFADLVYRQFDKMQTYSTLCYVDIDKDRIWDAYLAAFPEGTNPVYQTNTEHDCSCCRSFIRTLGRVVAVTNTGERVTLWGITDVVPEPYSAVARALHALVMEAPIAGAFTTSQTRIGTPKTLQHTGVTWHHFHANVAAATRVLDPSKDAGRINSIRHSLGLAVQEIKMSAIADVLDLIENNSLYRGAQYKKQVQGFQQLLDNHNYLAAGKRDAYLWNRAWSMFRRNASSIRSSSIGQLLTNLSKGLDVETAVGKYEAMVAPQNYQRTSSLITPTMINQAFQSLDELGLGRSIERRMAAATDLSMDDIIWTNRSTAPLLKSPADNAKELLKEHLKPKGARGVEHSDTIMLETFLHEVLPTAQKVEILFEGPLRGHLMALTTAVHEDAPSLFSWQSSVAWTYRGDVTDSIKERVKDAGGDVYGKGRVSLAWENHCDYDIHVRPPSNIEIFYGNKQPEPRGGRLDVDMHVSPPFVAHPVENITWPQDFPDGTYDVWVHNFTQRAEGPPGFTVEVADLGVTDKQFSYDKPIPNKATIQVCRFEVKDEQITAVRLGSTQIKEGDLSREIWGLATNEFHRVDLVAASPNRHEGRGGNAHWFFILQGCRVEEPVRGFYTEFLKPELRDHRKVFEHLGAKTMCPVAENQLCGLGFSETVRTNFIARVRGDTSTRTYKVSI